MIERLLGRAEKPRADIGRRGQSNPMQSIKIEKRPLAICPAAFALNVVRWAASRLEVDANSDVAAL